MLGSWGHIALFLFPTNDVMLVCVAVNEKGKPRAKAGLTCLTFVLLWLPLASVRPAPSSLLAPGLKLLNRNN